MTEAYFPEAKQLDPYLERVATPPLGNGLFGGLPDASGILSTSHTGIQCLVKINKKVVYGLRQPGHVRYLGSCFRSKSRFDLPLSRVLYVVGPPCAVTGPTTETELRVQIRP